ncbi:MAG: sensor histidine kinase [Clostridiales Family XIII bacterium]|jgi:two-component system sensor histidine kinase YesM|nr:sensor histidine kinase [Clostridiales Family XIII bacterium]
MTKKIKKLHNLLNTSSWGFKRKLGFFVTLILLVSSAVILIIYSVTYVSSITARTKSIVTTQLHELSVNYKYALTQYCNLGTAIILNEDVDVYCDSINKDNIAEYPFASDQMYNTLIRYKLVQPNCNFLAVIPESSSKGSPDEIRFGGNYVSHGLFAMTSDNFGRMYVLDYANSKPIRAGSKLRISINDVFSNTGDYSLSIYYPIFSGPSLYNNQKGVLLLNFSDTFLNQFDSRTTVDQDLSSELILAGSNGQALKSGGRYAQPIKIKYSDKLLYSSGSFQQEGKLINYQRVGDWDLYLINEISLFDLYQNGIQVAVIIVILILAMMTATILVIRRLTNKFYEPIDEVISAMDTVVDKELRLRIETHSMDHDSKVLAEGFNSMIDDIDELMTEVKREQKLIDQIRLEALQSQIKPHFLYNTLECIRWQAMSEGNREVATMVNALGGYYRICLSKGEDIISLKDEIEHIRLYMIIQNMRYDDILDLQVNIPEEFNDIKIPKLTLQPLVENAIYHGLRVEEGKRGSIYITLEAYEDAVFLYLTDNGVGMTEEDIQRLNNSFHDEEHPVGYGVRNVNKRIELLFGKQYGLNFQSNANGGVIITIGLPRN